MDKDLKRSYLLAYKIFAICFIAGIPTVFFAIASLGVLVGISAHLVTGLMKSAKARSIFYITTLVLSAAFVVAMLVNLLVMTDEFGRIDSATFLFLAVVVLLGFITAYVLRLYACRMRRNHELELAGLGKPRKYKSGTLRGAMKRPDVLREDSGIKPLHWSERRLLCVLAYVLAAGLFLYGMLYEDGYNFRARIPFDGQWLSFRGLFISAVGLVIFARTTYLIFKHKKH